MITTPVSTVNRKALISFSAALLTLLALCLGFLPIPFTVIICYPPGILLGVISLVYGAMALREIRADGKRGRRLALASMWFGGFLLSVAACMIMIGVLLYPQFVEMLHQIGK